MAPDEVRRGRRRVGRPDRRARRGAIAGSRSSRTGASRWAPRTRIRTARSGPARRCPREAAREDAAQRRHCDAARPTGSCSTTPRQEAGGPRVVEENDEWLVVVPFWATWPFETLVIPRRPVERLPDLDDRQRDALADDASSGLLGRYDALFERPFPYSMGWHQAPFGRTTATADRPLAAPRPLLSAAAAGDGPQVHGRLRAARRDPARPDRRGGRRAAARGRARSDAPRAGSPSRR